ncbi:NADP-dependent oxidoreductase domain-containing protein [Xylaria acuta]|nr:NADP-dependent oxidoreductase domain-containing protein [Xylaria acuta]
MQFTLATIATLVGVVSAQTWNDIPACAQPCILDAVAAVTDCGSTDYECICASRDTVQNEAASCVISACGLDVAINEVIPAVNAACDAIEQSAFIMPPQKLPLGRDGPLVRQLGFGLMELSISYEDTNLSDAERFGVLDRAWELGATFWDTAAGYGDSEALIGKWLKLHPERRQDIPIGTKFGFGAKVGKDGKISLAIDNSAENCRRSCEKTLQNLGVDSIDLFYVHRFDRITPVEKIMEALVELKRQGKIKYIGLSEPSSDTVRRACAIHSVSVVQIQYNPWSLDIETEMGTNLLATCRELGVAIVPYSPLGRGFLTGKFKSLDDLNAADKRRALPRFSSENFPRNLELANALKDMAATKNCTPAQLTLAWIMAQGQDMFPIPGTKNLKYLDQNAGSVEVEITSEDDERIREMIKLMGGASGARQVAQGNALADTPKLN